MTTVVERNSSMLDAECDRKIKSECSGTLSGPHPVKNINAQVCHFIKYAYVPVGQVEMVKIMYW